MEDTHLFRGNVNESVEDTHLFRGNVNESVEDTHLFRGMLMNQWRIHTYLEEC